MGGRTAARPNAKTIVFIVAIPRLRITTLPLPPSPAAAGPVADRTQYKLFLARRGRNPQRRKSLTKVTEFVTPSKAPRVLNNPNAGASLESFLPPAYNSADFALPPFRELLS